MTSTLRRTFGIAFGVSVGVGSTIGAGILRAPADVAQLLPSPGLFLAAWIVGGCYALLGANALAELGTMLPRSGGQYIFVRRALGPYAGFVVGWNDWISTCGAVAAISIVVGEAVAAIIPLFSHAAIAIAATAIIAVTAVTARGAQQSNVTQQLTSALKFAVLLALVAACVVYRVTHSSHIADAGAGHGIGPMAGVGAFIVALQGIIYAYDGWTGIIYFSEEVTDSERSIPRSMFLGVISIIVLYVLLNLAFMLVLPLSALAKSPLAAATVAAEIFGRYGSVIVQIIIVIALPSAVVANTLMASRVGFALARDRFAPRSLTNVNSGGTPITSLIGGSAIAMLFLLTGTFERVIAICSFLFVASYAMSFASIFVLRRKEPETPRPFMALGHPYSTGLITLASVAFLVGSALADKTTGVIALGLALASYPAYKMVTRST